MVVLIVTHFELHEWHNIPHHGLHAPSDNEHSLKSLRIFLRMYRHVEVPCLVLFTTCSSRPPGFKGGSNDDI